MSSGSPAAGLGLEPPPSPEPPVPPGESGGSLPSDPPDEPEGLSALASGAGALLWLQGAVNAGVALSVLPTKGTTLDHVPEPGGQQPASAAEEQALALWPALAKGEVDAFGALFTTGATWWTDSGRDRDSGERLIGRKNRRRRAVDSRFPARIKGLTDNQYRGG